MKNTDKLKQDIITLAEKKNFEGVDANLEISLFEYGLIGQKQSDPQEYFCIYATSYSENSNDFEAFKFDKGYITENDLIDILEYGKKGFLSFVGLNLSNWKKQSFISKVNDLIQYFGRLNVFGDSCYPLSLNELKTLLIDF